MRGVALGEPERALTEKEIDRVEQEVNDLTDNLGGKSAPEKRRLIRQAQRWFERNERPRVARFANTFLEVAIEATTEPEQKTQLKGGNMVDVIKAQQPVLILIVIVVLVATLALGYYGIVLVRAGDTADTEFVLFGQTFQSSSVGATAIFIAAVIMIVLIRGVLKNLRVAGKAPGA